MYIYMYVCKYVYTYMYIYIYYIYISYKIKHYILKNQFQNLAFELKVVVQENILIGENKGVFVYCSRKLILRIIF